MCTDITSRTDFWQNPDGNIANKGRVEHKDHTAATRSRQNSTAAANQQGGKAWMREKAILETLF